MSPVSSAAFDPLSKGPERPFTGRTALDLSELDAASSLACESLDAVSDRERAQASTLLVHAYEEVRHAVSFVRWRQRDELVPSLLSGRF